MERNEVYNVVILTEAMEDMRKIFSGFIAFGSRQGAKRIKEKFGKAMDRVSMFPYSSPACIDEVLAEAGFRMIVEEKYIMIYRVNEEAKEVVFYNVFNGKEDYIGLMRSIYFN